MIGIDVIVHAHRLKTNAAFDFDALTLKHIVAVECRNRFAIGRPAARAGVDRRILPREELHVDGNRAVAPLEAGLDTPLPQRLDVVGVQINDVLV